MKSAPAEFQELRLEVLSLSTTLQALADESSSPTSIILLAPPQRQESLRVLLENCTKGLKQLELILGKYPSLGPNEKTRFLEHIRFASKGKQGPRDKLAIHTASINIFLTSLTHSSLGRLELLIKNALRRGEREKGAMSALDVIQEPDAWHSIGQDLALEGITSDAAARFKHEIEAYTRHLFNGGKPFWMKSHPNPPQSYSASSPAQGAPAPQSVPRPQGAAPRYEASERPSPPPSIPPASQQRPSSLFGSTPQSNVPRNQYSFGQTSSMEYAPPMPPQAAPGNSNSNQQQSQTTTGASKPLYKLSSSSGNPPTSNPFGSPPDTNVSGSGQQQSGFGGFGSQTSSPGGPFGNGTSGEASGSQSTEQNTSHLTGATPAATGGGPFGQPAQQSQQQSTSGGLFGPKPLPGSGRFGSSKQSQPAMPADQTSSVGSSGKAQSFGFTTAPAAGGGLFGNGKSTTGTGYGATPAQPATTGGFSFGQSSQQTQQPAQTSGGIFSQPAQQQSGGLFGNARPATGGGLFGGLGSSLVDTKTADELADLFDHIFDIDENATAMAQGARNTPYPMDSQPAPLSNLGYVPPVYTPPFYSPPPAPLPAPNAYQSIYQLPEVTHTPADRRLGTSTIALTDNIVNNNLLHTVRMRLEEALIQYRDAQRAGDAQRADHLLQNAIQERITYLRNAGAVVIQCDLCHAPIIDEYYHCDVCANGDWDCCPKCLEQGKGCLGGHGLGRRNKDWVGEKHWTRC